MNFADHLYERLPEVYRREDARKDINFTLKRYLEALDEGGVQLVFSELLSLYDILEVDKCPPEVLPLLSKMLGYNYIEEVDVETQRKIIANLIELYKRKGTKSVINFITREFTQFDTKVIELQYRIFKTWSPNPKGVPKADYVEPRTLGNKMTYDTCHLYSQKGMYNYKGVVVVCDAQASQVELLNRLLREFLPVYCNLYLKINDEVQQYLDSCTVNGTDVSTGVKVKEIEQAVRTKVKDSLKVTYNTTNETMEISTEETNKSSVTQKAVLETSSTKSTDTSNSITIKDADNPNVSITFEFTDTKNIKEEPMS
jgi:phage tail-like protein